MARSNLVPHAFIWEKLLESHLMEETYSKLHNNSDPCIKSDFKDFFLKLASKGQSDKAFLLTSELCPQRVVCPCPGAIYMWKKNNKKCV